MHPTPLLWHGLNVLTKERYDAVMHVFGSLDEAAKHINADFLRNLGCRADTIQTALRCLDTFDADAVQQELDERGVKMIAIDDPAYPKHLNEIGDPPVFLTYRGDLSILNEPCVALVGTREMCAYGKRVTEEFTKDFVHAGMTTVSGLARGVDATVAKQTLDSGGKTVAALGHGLGKIYPKENAPLADQIVDEGGLLLSEFPLHMESLPYMFPARNRIIAGLSMGTVVLEAPEGSGALITAELSLEYCRDAFAVPGSLYDPHYAGSNALIAKGHAQLVTCAADVLRGLGIATPESRQVTRYEPQNAAEGTLLGVLTAMPQPIDELVDQTKMPTSLVNTALTMMELAGAVRNVGNGMWIRN